MCDDGYVSHVGALFHKVSAPLTDMEQAIDEESMKCFVLFVSSCSQKEIGHKSRNF